MKKKKNLQLKLKITMEKNKQGQRKGERAYKNDNRFSSYFLITNKLASFNIFF